MAAAKLPHDRTASGSPSLSRNNPMPDEGSDRAPEERWRALIEQYGRYLRRVIVRLCPRDLGLQFDDIEQEARLRLWKALQGERRIDDPASYLYRIAATATIDAIRRVRARREDSLEDEAGEEDTGKGAVMAGAPSLEEAAGRGILIERVEGVLRGLPPERRRLLRLHFQGFSSQEIADLLEWTEPKARNLVYRTLRDLRESLRAQGIEYEGD